MEENEKDKNKSQFFLEVYKQAHETRRKWESYIWQYGFLVTILSAIFVKWTEISNAIGIPEKLILSLVTLFIFAIFLNVLRARTLMKKIEKNISRMHEQFEIDVATIPSELNKDLKGIYNISSTKVAVFVHLLATIIFLIVSLIAWFPC